MPSSGRAILDRLFKAVGSAGEVVRGAVAALKPDADRGAGHKICICKKKIDVLYTEIGRGARALSLLAGKRPGRPGSI